MAGKSAIGQQMPQLRAVVAAGMLAVPTAATAQVQPAPQYLCQMAAQTSQQGGPVVYSVFGQQLSQLIYQQTGGTGSYGQLVQLGHVTNVVIGGVNQLPNGMFVSCRVMHVNGYSDWQIGYSPFTQRIENSSFLPYWTAGQILPPQQAPSGNPGTISAPPIQQQTGKPPPPPPKVTQSDACKKFPDLC